jgi:S1-C subfamily serine protease
LLHRHHGRGERWDAPQTSNTTFIDGAIQTGAAINQAPGAHYNSHGDVIGINYLHAYRRNCARLRYSSIPRMIAQT